MECPHCLVTFSPAHARTTSTLGASEGNMVMTFGMDCPECGRLVGWYTQGGSTRYIFFPPVHATTALPDSIPEDLRIDYAEACAVLPHSARASAALRPRPAARSA